MPTAVELGTVTVADPAEDPPPDREGTDRDPLRSTSPLVQIASSDRKYRVTDEPAGPAPTLAVVSETLNAFPALTVVGLLTLEITRSGRVGVPTITDQLCESDSNCCGSLRTMAC